MASIVFLPITLLGGARSTFGSRAPRSERASSEISIPVISAPPTYSPSRESTSKVVAVPKSTQTAGPPKRARMATALTRRSAPISRGLS